MITPKRVYSSFLANIPLFNYSYVRKFKTKYFPKQPPSIRKDIRWIAQLGEFLGRKNDLEQGPGSLWKGWKQRLFDLTQG